MLKRIFLFCFFLVQESNAFDPEKFDYCKIRCISRDTHSACKCEDGPNTIITEDMDKFRKTMLKLINDYRNETAADLDKTMPAAANMMVLKYSNELEHIAKCYAKKVNGKKLEHDKCRRKHDRGTVGQTYYFTTTAVTKAADYETHYKKFRDEWNKQMKDYKKNKTEIVASFEDSAGIDFFAQTTWAKSTEVGCIRATSKQLEYQFFIICNFAEAGNIVKKPIYLAGQPCTKCEENSKCKSDNEYPLLCYPSDFNKNKNKNKKTGITESPNVTMAGSFPLMFRDTEPTPNGSEFIDKLVGKNGSNQGIHLVLVCIVLYFIVLLY